MTELRIRITDAKDEPLDVVKRMESQFARLKQIANGMDNGSLDFLQFEQELTDVGKTVENLKKALTPPPPETEPPSPQRDWVDELEKSNAP